MKIPGGLSENTAQFRGLIWRPCNILYEKWKKSDWQTLQCS